MINDEFVKNDDFDFIDSIFNFFRKKVKKLSAEQNALLISDMALVNGRCKEIADKRNQWENDWEKKHNTTCPNCGAKIDIVNKIREVHGGGSGSVSGGLFGGVHGSSSMSIGTAAVNHCNKCGNEWKKYKKDWKSEREVKQDGIKYVARIIKDFEEYKWGKDHTKIFEGCYLETILKFAEENNYSLYDGDREMLCTSKLKYYYKSLWDDPNEKRTLLKLF